MWPMRFKKSESKVVVTNDEEMEKILVEELNMTLKKMNVAKADDDVPPEIFYKIAKVIAAILADIHENRNLRSKML